MSKHPFIPDHLMPDHPIQPVGEDKHGMMRFKENAIVRFLLNTSKFNLNDIAEMNFSIEDHEHLAQLIGYSLTGFFDLDYVQEETRNRVDAAGKRFISDQEKALKDFVKKNKIKACPSSPE